MPGPLGFEPGATPPAPGPRAYQTRAYSGLDSPEAKTWGEANGLGRVPWFSHNLYNVFPAALYATRPEFFPLVDGQRRYPTPNRYNWNPDIARIDVADYAADAAIAYFAANPTAESFALGTNDGVIFGESPELLALVEPGAPAVAATPPRSLASSDGFPASRDAVAPLAQRFEPLSPADAGHRAEGEAHGTAFANSEHRDRSAITDTLRGEAALRPADAGHSRTSGSASPTRWFRGRPDYSNLVFTFTNRVAERVAARYPDKYLGALAYYWSENAPDFPVHPNVMPFLTADRSQGYDAAFRAEEADLQARWAAALGLEPSALGAVATDGTVAAVSRGRGMRSDASRQSVAMPRSDPLSPADAGHRALGEAREHRVPQSRDTGLYDYLYGYGFLIPRLHPTLIAPSIRDARRLGFTDYFAEMNPNWGLDGPQPWLVAQLLQDPEADPRPLLDEYYARNFREAARPMRQFFEACERIWLAQPGSPYWLKHYRNESQAALFPPQVCADLRRKLDEAARRADSPEVAARVAFVADAFGLTERFSALHATRTALASWALSTTAEADEGRRRLAAFTAARAEFLAYAAALRERAPLAVYPFRLDDYLQSDPTWMAVARLVALGGAPEVGPETDPGVAAAVRVLTAKDRVPVEIVRDGGFEGVVVPARRIAGLPYGVDATAAWASANEPRETMRFALDAQAARSGRQGLRIVDALGASLFQWHGTSPGKAHVATVRVRGRLAPSSYATLTLTWTNERQQTIGSRTVARLPEGEWPEWVELLIGGEAPPGAKFVVVAITAQYQTDGAWVEFDEVSLKEH